MTNTIPNLAGVATANLVEQIGTGRFTASYINWSRTMALLREHAPGWQPELVNAPVPQAIMDVRNAAIPIDKITARDITDTHRRGVCMAAAFTFGLAYELWAKLPLESGYAEQETPTPKVVRHRPVDGSNVTPERKLVCDDVVTAIQECIAREDVIGAYGEYEGLTDPEEKTYAWSFLDAPTRKALKAHNDTLKKAA